MALIAAGCAKDLPIDIPGLKLAKPSDTEQIRSVIDDAYRAMEGRRINKVMANVSKKYYDEEGRDYEALREHLETVFRHYREIIITRAEPKIAVEGDRAKALETFGTIAKPFSQSDLPINLQGQVYVYLEKIEGSWQIVQWGSLM
jgi:hypothetical protein